MIAMYLHFTTLKLVIIVKNSIYSYFFTIIVDIIVKIIADNTFCATDCMFKVFKRKYSVI